MSLEEYSSTQCQPGHRLPADANVVWLHGEHDADTAMEFWELLTEVIESGTGNVVIDLSGTQFMGASTVGVMVRGRNRLAAQSRVLMVRSPSAFAQRVLDLCELACSTRDAEPDGSELVYEGSLASWVQVPPVDGQRQRTRRRLSAQRLRGTVSRGR